MKTKLKIILILIVSIFISNLSNGACTPTTSPTCATAQSLTVGGACINGTSCDGGSEDVVGYCLGEGS